MDPDGGWTPPPDVREPCAERDPNRRVLFGDLHVHTAHSFDAWLSSVVAGPADAYRFARGEALELPVAGPGVPQGRIQLDRPLDFAAVTDHAEFLAEVNQCSEPGTPGYDSDLCADFRERTETIFQRFGAALTRSPAERFEDLCPPGGETCPALVRTNWERIQQAAEEAYDRTAACSFSSFVAYEWSGSVNLANLHRNVVFRSSAVPRSPTSYFEEPTPWGLFDVLRDACLDGIDGCDVLSIPHNSNWSNGNLFFPEYPQDRSEVASAELRARLEPLVEIYQHKGDSECEREISGILGPPDELCGFEKLRVDFEDCGDETGTRGMLGLGCVSRLDFVRGALLEGLKEELRLGVNPYRLGIVASTDTHNATPGYVAEDRYAGHFGDREGQAETRMFTGTPSPGGVRNGPGGLVAVWAEENSRESIFDALTRRETYGTSGPRITVRFFGGWDLPEDACARGDLVEAGYAGGVPMGGVLAPAPPGATPRFVISAMQDPGVAEHPGTPLQRVQLVKGWIDGEGESRVRIIDVAGGENGADVDLETCSPRGEGNAALCGVFQDSEFDQERPAYYYVRVLENPTCRWSTRECLGLTGSERPEACDDPSIPATIQERAWTSPIWYSG